MRRLSVFVALAAALVASPSVAQELEEIVVTGSRVSAELPGRQLRRTADNILLSVEVTNDSRDEEQRESEIHETILRALKAAERNPRITLSTVSDGGFVLPVTRANYRVELGTGKRPDTSRTSFRAKSAIPADVTDGEALVLELKRFVEDIEMVGRTRFDVYSDIQVSVVDPEQYRAAAIQEFADDVKTVTAALGDDYRVVVHGIDDPIEYVRVGSLSVAIYIPYTYQVVPTSLGSITYIPDY